MKIDFSSLTLQNTTNKFLNEININVFGDWAPALGNNSNLFYKLDKKFYSEISKFIEKANFNIINFETVIDNKAREFYKGAVRLIDDIKILNSLQSLKPLLACLANNHILDNGIEGLNSTIQSLKGKKINITGADFLLQNIYKPFSINQNNNNISIINCAEGEEANEKYNNHKGAADIESFRIIDEIRRAKRKDIFVIVIAHAGVEFIPTPPPHIKDLYHTFVDVGADLIIGHHPHVPQGVEVYKNSPIFYSLGNFGIYRPRSRQKEKEGYFLNITIANSKSKRIQIIPYEISFDGIKIRNRENFDIFKQEFEYISKLIGNSKSVNEIWQLYSNYRYPILDFNKIIKINKFNEKIAREAVYNLMTQYSRRFVALCFKKFINGSNLEYIDLLDKFGAKRQTTINEKIFLLFRNKLYWLWITSTTIMKLLRYIKKVMNKEIL